MKKLLQMMKQMKMIQLPLLKCTEMSDLMTLGICPVKSFDHADLSNEETIENDETGEDDKLVTTEVSESEN